MRRWLRILLRISMAVALAFWTRTQLTLAGQRWHSAEIRRFVGSPFPSDAERQAMDWGTPLLLALLPWVLMLLWLGVRRWQRRRSG